MREMSYIVKIETQGKNDRTIEVDDRNAAFRTAYETYTGMSVFEMGISKVTLWDGMECIWDSGKTTHRIVCELAIRLSEWKDDIVSHDYTFLGIISTFVGQFNDYLKGSCMDETVTDEDLSWMEDDIRKAFECCKDCGNYRMTEEDIIYYTGHLSCRFAKIRKDGLSSYKVSVTDMVKELGLRDGDVVRVTIEKV